MTYNGVVQRKLALLTDRVAEIRTFLAQVDRATFIGDRVLQMATERALQVCAEVMIDVAERIVAIEGVGPVSGAREALAKLATLGVITDAAIYQSIVRFRNLIVHQYETIDPNVLFELATTRLDDILAFRDEIDAAG